MNSIIIVTLCLSITINLFKLINFRCSSSKYYFHVSIMTTDLMIFKICLIIPKFYPFIIVCSPFMTLILFSIFLILRVFLLTQLSSSYWCLPYCCFSITIFMSRIIIFSIRGIQLEPSHILMIQVIINFLHNQPDEV